MKIAHLHLAEGGELPRLATYVSLKKSSEQSFRFWKIRQHSWRRPFTRYQEISHGDHACSRILFRCFLAITISCNGERFVYNRCQNRRDGLTGSSGSDPTAMTLAASNRRTVGRWEVHGGRVEISLLLVGSKGRESPLVMGVRQRGSTKAPPFLDGGSEAGGARKLPPIRR